VEDPRITNTNEKGDMNMNTNEQWKKLMLLVMKFFELQNELTNLRIEEMNEWEPPSIECDACFAKAVEEAAQDEHGFDDEFQGEWA
jgi:uncharacterized protein YdaU (DUF1376 family)